jgi:hypothetical protein
MRKADSKVASSPVKVQENDYSPKTYTFQEKITFGVKLLTATGIIALLLWLFG